MEDVRSDLKLIDATPLDVTPVDVTPSVLALQNVMRSMEQFEPPTTHYFADGMYCRVVERPAGCVIIGKQHKRAHFYMVVQGSVAVIQDGAERKVYDAPAIIVSQPGTKRAVVALTDAVCLTVHRTDNTDLSVIESELLEPDDLALFGPDNKLKALEHQE